MKILKNYLIYILIVYSIFCEFLSKLLFKSLEIPILYTKAIRDLLIVMIILLALFNIIHNKIKIKSTFLLPFIFLCGVVLTSLGKVESIRFLLGAREILLYPLLFLSIVYDPIDKDAIKNSVKILLSCSFIVGLFGIMQFFSESLTRFLVKTGVHNIVSHRASSFIGSPNHLALFLVLSIFLHVFINNKFNRYISLIIHLACLLLTFSRSGLIALIISGIVFLVIDRDKKKIKLAKIIGSLILIFLLIVTNVPFIHENIRYRFSPTKIIDDFMAPHSRFYSWTERLDEIEPTEFTFGRGVGIYGPTGVHLDDTDLVVDNAYLKLFLEIGIMGLLSFLVFLYLVFKTCYLRINSKTNLAIFCFMIGFLVAALFGDVFQMHPVSELFWLFASFLIIKPKKTKKDSLALIVGDIFSKLFGFLIIVYMSRALGPTEFGIYGLALSVGYILQIILDFGFEKFIIREVSKNNKKSHGIITSVIFLKIVLCITTLIILLLLLALNSFKTYEIIIILLVYISLIVESFGKLIRSFFVAIEFFNTPGFVSSIKHLMLLFTTFFFILSKTHLKWDYNPLIYIVSAFVIINTVELVVLSQKFKNNIGYTFEVYPIRNIIKQTYPFALGLIFVALYFRIDTIMLSTIKGQEAVGYYTVPYFLIFSLIFIPNTIMTTLYPKMSILAVKAKKRLTQIYYNILKLMLLITIPSALLISYYSENIILFLYGSEYYFSILALKILVWGVVLSSISHLFLYTLNSLNKQIIYTKVVGLSVVINIILNLFLIPRYDLYGAAFATVATEGLACVFLYIKTKKLLS